MRKNQQKKKDNKVRPFNQKSNNNDNNSLTVIRSEGRTEAITELYGVHTNNTGDIELVKLNSVQYNTIKSIEPMDTNQICSE